jgi:hypothetical protein
MKSLPANCCATAAGASSAASSAAASAVRLEGKACMAALAALTPAAGAHVRSCHALLHCYKGRSA